MSVTDELDWRCFPAREIAQFDGSEAMRSRIAWNLLSAA